MRRLSLLAFALLLTACGGGGAASRDPVQSVPSENGIRAAVQKASDPTKTEFPAAQGKTLEQLANTLTAGPQVAMASSVFTAGEPDGVRRADQGGEPVYGKTAVYIAPKPGDPAKGPYLAPADVLLTDKRYRSQQAAQASRIRSSRSTARRCRSGQSGGYAVLTATRAADGKMQGATSTVDVISKAADLIPEVGQKAPKVHTDTLATRQGRRDEDRHAPAA